MEDDELSKAQTDATALDVRVPDPRLGADLGDLRVVVRRRGEAGDERQLARPGREDVLTRAERIVKLQDKDAFTDGESSPLGIPKVRSIKMQAGKKKPTKAPGAEEKDK